jgi:formate hydrogenlyase subunit 4
MSGFISLIESLLFIMAAPLLAGWIKWVKCRLQNRKAPSLLQPYRELAKLFAKQPVVAEQASWLFEAAPYVIFASMVLAASVVPFIAVHLPAATIADVIALVGFLALGRFFLILAGMDVGTAFGGMGASREAMVASLGEPAMLMAIFALSMSAGTTNLALSIDYVLDNGVALRPSFIFSLAGMALVAVAETGRVPVDNPATHLELTMIHEAMILEYSGRYLALIEWAAEIKLMLYGVLIANIFFPWGIAEELTLSALAAGTGFIFAKLAGLGVALAVSEALFAKMRVFRVQDFLGFAYLLSLLGMLSHVILEVGQ